VSTESQTEHYLQKYINLIQAMTEIIDIISKCPNQCNKKSEEILQNYGIVTNSTCRGGHELDTHAREGVINEVKIRTNI